MTSRRKRDPLALTDENVADGLGFRLMRKPAMFGARVAGLLGADRAAAEAILLTRLRLDMRTGGLKQPNKPGGGGLLATCAIYLVFGGMLGFVELIDEISPAHAIALVQGVLLVLIAMLLISDYVAILIDPAEADVVAPRPVTGRTLLLARIVHLVLYLVPPVASFMLGPFVTAFFRPDAWVFVPTLPLVTVLTCLLAVSGVLVVFVWLMRRLDSERLANVLLRAQIGSNLLIFVMYTVGVSMLARPEVRGWLASGSATLLLVPPLWSGGLLRVLSGDSADLAPVQALLAVMVPVLLMLLVVLLAGDRFVMAVASLRAPSSKLTPARPGRIRRLASRLVADGTERAGFDCFLELSVRERGFRTRVYPMLVVPFFMIVYSLVRADERDTGGIMVWGAFIPMLYAVLILTQVRYSDTPRAAWIFAATPLADHGLFVAGVVKAVVFGFLVPWILLVMLVATLAAQTVPLTDVVFGVEVSALVTLVAARFVMREAFPFSREFTPRQGGQQALMFGVMFGVGLAAGLRALLAMLPWGVEIGAVLLVPLIVWRMRKLRELRVDPQSIPI